MVEGIFLAKRRDERLSFVIRPYRKAVYDSLSESDFLPSPEQINALILSKSPEDLLAGINGLHPLSFHPLTPAETSSRVKRGRAPRITTVESFHAGMDEAFEPVEIECLEEELTALRSDTPSLNMSSTRRVLKNNDAFSTTHGILRHLEKHKFADDDLVSIEPLCDWTFMKNMLSLGIEFEAVAATTDSQGRLLKTFQNGVEHVGDWALIAKNGESRRVYRKLFVHNSDWWFTEGMRERISDSFKKPFRSSAATRTPLLTRFCPFSDDGPRLFLGLDGAHLVAWPRVAGDGEKPAKGSRQTERGLYITLDDKKSEAEWAADGLSAMLEQAERLKSESGSPLGWSFEYSQLSDSPAFPRVTVHSQIGGLFYAMAFHGDYRSTWCRHCGRPFLAPTKGKQRLFCCATCRKDHSLGTGDNDA